jgi:hypothetical protein
MRLKICGGMMNAHLGIVAPDEARSARLPDHFANKVADLLPSNWKVNQSKAAAAA